MHRALYRTYRPATFDEVVGQEHITSVLRYEVKNGKTSHAYLFCGSRGTGKTSCAKILAKAVNCLHPENGNPCSRCENCLAIEKGATTDVLEMDAASNTGVDYIRDIKDAVMYAPSMLKNRVYIIDEVHMLSDGAFNALLKTLEEPPANVVFILATTEMQKIPATILSRCQRFEFGRIASSVIAGHLQMIAEKEGLELTDEAAYLIARNSQGGMRDAISLFELCSANRQKVDAATVVELSGGAGRKAVEETVEALASGDGARLFSLIASLYASSGDLSSYWQDLLGYYRDMIAVRALEKADPEKMRREILDLTENEYATLKTLAGRFSYETLIYHSAVLGQALPAVSGRIGTSGRIAAEITLVKLSCRTMDETPAALAQRLTRIEALLAGAEAVSVPAQTPARSQERAPAPTSEKTAAPETPAQAGACPGATAPSQGQETKSAAPAEEKVENAQLKEFKDFPEALHEYTKEEPGCGAYLAGARAYLFPDGSLEVAVKSPFAVMLLESRGAARALEKIVGAQTGKTPKEVRFRYAQAEAPDDGQEDWT